MNWTDPARVGAGARTTLAWETPRVVSVVVDRIDDCGFGVHDRFGEVVQIIVGRRVDASFLGVDGSVTAYISDGADGAELVLEDVVRATVSLVEAVQEQRVPDVQEMIADRPALPTGADFDETVVVPFVRSTRLPAQDFDETVVALTPPAAAASAQDLDETIVVEQSRADPSAISVVIHDGSLERPMRVQAGLVLGRAPRVPAEQTSGSTALVIVGAHGDRISGSHLLVRNEGGIALARDLWSTNGTGVTPPYGAPYRLRGGEDAPLLPGSVLDLGDDVTMLISAAPHGA